MITLEAKPLLALRGLVRQTRGRVAVTALPGGLVTRRRGRGLETAELRAFAPGDDPRHVDRNATARTGELKVRMFHAEQDQTTVLLADFRPSMLWGTRRTLRSVAAAEALAIIGWTAVQSGGRVGLIAVTAEQNVLVPPRGRDAAMIRVIGAMVRAHATALHGAVSQAGLQEPPLETALDLARRAAPRGAEVWLASALDTPGQAFGDRVLALTSRATLRVVHIEDAFETAPPPGRYRFATRANPQGGMGRPGGSARPAVEMLELLGLPYQRHAVDVAPEFQPEQSAGHA